MKHILYGITTVLCAAFSGCDLIYEDMEELGYRENGEAYAYVSLTINTATESDPGTRSNPTGGETGDGFEEGQTYENAVNDLTLFFYVATPDDGGVNKTGDNIEFIATQYISDIGAATDGTQPIDKTYSVGPFKIEGLRTNQQYHVLAVANAGNLSSSITTLNALRSETINKVYTATVTTTDGDAKTTYSNFVMASERDEYPVLDIAMDNSQSNPAETTIDLERLAARVDYKTNDNNSYTLNDGSITASITRAMLVNVYNQESYLLKRVAENNISSTLTYLGDETTSNFVIDPNTSAKTANPIATGAANWYDNYFPNISDEVEEDGTTAWEKLLTAGWNIDGWNCIGYPKENTTSVEAQGKYYSTGVVFEATYKGITGVTEEGATFFRVDGTTIYATLDAAMKAHNGEQFTTDRTFSNYDDLQAYINDVLVDDDPAGYKAYLLTAKNNESDYSKYGWSNYKKEILGYDENGNPTAKTRQALHERVVGENKKTETFLNGRGYYTYWIRHNGNGTDLIPGQAMGLGIVRNNIYKLTVNSISEIGNDVPGDKTLDILVAVAQWNRLPDESIELN